MFNRERYRSLARTFVADVRVREVTQTQNTVKVRQSHAVGIPDTDNYTQMSMIVDNKGVTLPETRGFLYIDCASPILMQIGDQRITIDGNFTVTGALPQVVLVSEKSERINVIQY